MLAAYHPRGIAMLAEKVETREEFDWARAAGYDYFQGYFFARPTMVPGRQISPLTAELRIAHSPHLAHAAFADRRNDFIRAKFVARLQFHAGRRGLQLIYGS